MKEVLTSCFHFIEPQTFWVDLTEFSGSSDSTGRSFAPEGMTEPFEEHDKATNMGFVMVSSMTGKKVLFAYANSYKETNHPETHEKCKAWRWVSIKAVHSAVGKPRHYELLIFDK